MKRTANLILFIVVGFLTLSAQTAKKPNIILVMSDDQGWGQMGYYNHPILKTPNLDKMAENGIRFNRFYAGAPVCSPTRASVLTGRSNDRTAVYAHGYAMCRQEKTLAQALKNAGYKTAHFGKWHLNGLRGPGVPILGSDVRNPGAFGFDEWLSVTNFFDIDPIMSHNGEFIEIKGESSEIIVNEALRFIEKEKDNGQPLFVVIWYGSPHSPWRAYETDKKTFGNLDKNAQNHYGELVNMDKSIGELRTGLRSMKIEENTLVWFNSDNGGVPNFGPETVGGLRGFKGQMYEGGLRVPCVIEWPAGIKPNRITDYPASTMDIFPTIADIVDLPKSSFIFPIDGSSIKELFTTDLKTREKPIPFRYQGKAAIVDNNYKLISLDITKNNYELYDLVNDPNETKNLVDIEKEIAKRMIDELTKWNQSVEESVAGNDYPNGLLEPNGYNIQWNTLPEYKPYFEHWKDRPEYREALKDEVNSSEIKKVEKVKTEVIYPKIRIWTSPSNGEEPAFNSPSFQWPSTKKASYSFRLSSSKDFSKNLIEKNEIPFAIFNPHKILNEGIWYWQYKGNSEKWNPIDSFTITTATPKFATPDIKTILAAIPSGHPRVLAKKVDLDELRQRAKNYKESEIIIQEANRHLNQTPPKEESALPGYTGKDDFENQKIASLASKWVGWNIYEVLNLFSQAYILTADEKYFTSAKKWMLEISKWDPKGPTHTNNFGDAGIMAGLAVGADTFWDLLSATERKEIIQQAAARADQFYTIYINQVESRSSSMHVWQHILHRMLYTSLAFVDDIPEANLWLEYIYELWIAQAPKMGEKDGAWFNGTSYFRMNTLTMYDFAATFKDLSGVDFMWSDWYKNNPRWLIYAFPPNSIADGFCNNGDRLPKPNINYAGYADAAARMFNDPYSSWYSNEIAKSLGQDISADDEFRWYRIQKGYKMKRPEPVKEFDLPQAALFPDVGVASMHTTLQNPETNLMLSLRSSPFGSLAHTHADQNTFNIAYGGKRLFYNSGYRPAMGDPHFLGWYKHTQGHNGILIDGEGQPFSDGAYGWIPRFLHGKQISYAVGDASNAYSGQVDGKNIDLGMKFFRRHYIMLRPSLIVIYDELEADHNAEWSWLLHNDKGFEIDTIDQTILAEGELAKAKVSLFSSSAIDFRVTDQFSFPVDNWTNKIDEDGDTLVYENQWHFKGVSKAKTSKMRYLAIIQVKPDGSFELISNNNDGNFAVGNWNIKAEMNVSKPGNIKVWNKDSSASFVSSGVLVNNEKTYAGKEISSSKLVEMIDGKEVFKEVVDEIPQAIRNVMSRETIMRNK